MKLLKKQAFNETWLALTDETGELVRLFISRGDALNLNETINGTITAHNNTLKGYFVQTEKQLPVFVPSTEKHTDGQSVLVEITKEARQGKDATGKFVTQKKTYPFVENVIKETGISQIENWEEETDAIIEKALCAHISFAKGATIHIERTNACWTIDIDSGNSPLPLPQINQAAASLIAKQILLKNMSGILLIDFAGFKTDTEQKELHNDLKKHLKSDKRSTLYGFSKTHLYEIKRKRTSASLIDLFLTPSGHLNPATTIYRIREEIARRKNPTVLFAHPSILPLLQNKIPSHIQSKPLFDKEPDYFEIQGE